MKTKKSILSKVSIIALLLFGLFSMSSVQAQSKTISGKITDEVGPMKDVNIILKGTKVGVVTNEKGEFTFPKELQVGDVLVVSYLGYKNQNITIDKNTSIINVELTNEMIEMVGALDSNKLYKSKKKRKK